MVLTLVKSKRKMLGHRNPKSLLLVMVVEAPERLLPLHEDLSIGFNPFPSVPSLPTIRYEGPRLRKKSAVRFLTRTPIAPSMIIVGKTRAIRRATNSSRKVLKKNQHRRFSISEQSYLFRRCQESLVWSRRSLRGSSRTGESNLNEGSLLMWPSSRTTVKLRFPNYQEES